MAFNTHIPLHFELVNKENRKEIEALTVFSEQASFIESVKDCLQEADELELWRPVGIYDGNTLVGFPCTVIFRNQLPANYGWTGCLLTENTRGKDTESRQCLPCFPNCTWSIRAIPYTSVYMRITVTRSSFISSLASVSTGNMMPKAKELWFILMKKDKPLHGEAPNCAALPQFGAFFCNDSFLY